MPIWLSQGVITPDGIDLPAGQDYQIDNVSVLNATTLGSGVVNSSLTSVGTLLNLTVTNTISGSVDGNSGTVTNGVYTTDPLSVMSATTSLQLAGVISDETGSGKLVFGTSPTFTTGITITGGGVINADGIDLVTGNDYQINNVSVLNATTLGSGVVNSSLTSVGTLTALNVGGDSSLDGAVVINETGADKDFRVESDISANALFVQGSDGRVGIGTGSPTSPLHIIANTPAHALKFQNIYLSGELFVGINSLGKDVFRLNQNGSGDAFFDMKTSDGGTTVMSMNAGNQQLYVMGNINCGKDVYAARDVGIGTLSPTARLHLPAGTAAASTAPLKFTTGVALTTPEAGALEFHNDRLYLTNVASRKVIDRSGDVALADVTVANTDTETTVYTATIGTNALKAGNVLKLLNSGIISSASAADVLTVNVYVGADLAATIDSPGKSLSNNCWHISGFATLRSAGVSGEMAYHLHMDIEDASAVTCDVITVDTTGANDITVKVEWNNAKAGNTVTLQQGIMEYKN